MSNTNIVIIGSGVAAVTVGRTILSRNQSARVQILEAGEYLQIPDYRKWLDFVMTGTSPTRAFRDKKGDADVNADGGFGLQGGRLIVRGGSTNHWGRMVSTYETGRLPSGAMLETVQSIGLSTTPCWRLFTHGPRHSCTFCGNSASTLTPRFGDPYPYEAVPFTTLDRLLMPTLERLGYEYDALPIARNPHRCITTGTCRYCPMGCKICCGNRILILS